MWYAFGAYNSPTLYGWTQDPAVAKAALGGLNKDREINVYGMEVISDEEAERLGLPQRSDLWFDDDTRLEDFEDNC
ncbi:hypothetical protein [Pedomonas sp. V897]|uniref:hypothetical protein n=1 Tax=Pedomonas sp. V897 TaxID=3446482 RepID=UPI003EDFD5D9